MQSRTLPRNFVLSTFAIVAAVLLLYRVTLAASSYQCPSGLNPDGSVVIGTTCYAFYDAAVTWSAAKTACENRGGTLATIRNAAVQNAIFTMSDGGSTDTWLGATDSGALLAGASEGDFFWIGDVAAFWENGQGGAAVGGAYTNWGTNEPNNAGGTEHCVEIYRTDGVWNDMTCTDPQKYVCEIAAVSVEESGGGGNALWLMQLRQENNLDTRGNPLSSVSSSASSSSSSSSSQQSSAVHPSASMTVSAASSVSSSLSSSSVSSSTPSSVLSPFQIRTCNRVRKWLLGNPSALQRLNARLLKSFDFTCAG